MSNSRRGLGYWLAVSRLAAVQVLGRSILRSALRRWRIGHQMFIVLDQMLLTAVVVLDRALAERDWQRAERGFDRLAQLFSTSTAALRHTGDFGPRVYDWLVAPDMVNFYRTPGMSGGNMLDHRLLVSAMRGMNRRHRETILLAPLTVYDAYLRFEHARATALDSHRNVCVWSARNRKSLASSIDEPAGLKIDRLNTQRRLDLHIALGSGRDEPSHPDQATDRYRATINHSRRRCPFAGLRELIVRLTTWRRLPRGR
jgi:hypothetical protein